MNAKKVSRLARIGVGLLSLGIAASPLLLAQPGDAAARGPLYRSVTPPNVFPPVTGARNVKDLHDFNKRRHNWTDIKTPCARPVYATHPGVVSAAWGSGARQGIRISTSPGGLYTDMESLSGVVVTAGQPIQSGQVVGLVGYLPRSTRCGMTLRVVYGSTVVNPTQWLAQYVGSPPPVGAMYGDPGLTIASMNMLGASHTTAGSGSRYGTYDQRMPMAMALWAQRGFDVMGLQEFQSPQNSYFLTAGGLGTYGQCYYGSTAYQASNPDWTSGTDTENSILYRLSAVTLESCNTIDIQYFQMAGQTSPGTRHIPIALFRENATGREFYLINTHNPADVWGNASSQRAYDIALERQKVIDLRATGKAVLFTGDFNDTQPAFCGLTTSKLMLTPNSVPSDTCAYPGYSIDWIFAAGQARFSSFTRDSYTQKAGITDHPVVYAHMHLQS